MYKLQLPSGENILMAAHAALAAEERTVDLDFVAAYERHFTPAVPALPKATAFERFSLIDPTIRTVIRSTTTQP